MGQNQARSYSSPFLAEKQTSKAQKKQQNPGICYTGPLGSSCFGTKDSKNKKNSGRSWKEHMKEQLSLISGDGWAQTLFVYLEENDTEEEDVIFQSELFWADFNSAKKPIHYNNKSLSSRPRKDTALQQPNPDGSGHWHEENSSLDDSKVDMNETGPMVDPKKDLSQDIKNMLEASALLEEKVYELAEKMNWTHKSFDLRRYEHVKSRSPSVDGVKLPGAFGDIRLVTKSLDYSKVPNNRLLNFSVNSKTSNTMEERKYNGSGVSGDSVWRQSGSMDAIENFENNTFLVQKHAAKKAEENEEQHRQSIEKEIMTSDRVLYRAVANYKTITSIIDKHLKQKGNVLCTLIELFEDYFERTYGDVNVRLKIGNISLIEANEYLLKATRDLQQFLRILYEGTNMFYKLDKLKVGRQTSEGCLFNRDNMLNFITSVVFNKKIYDVIFKLYQLRNAPSEKSFERGLRKCKKFTPLEYGITEEYSLDDKTVKFLQEKDATSQIVMDEHQLEEFNVLDATVLDKEKVLPKSSTAKQDGVTQEEESKKIYIGPKSCEKSYEKPIQILKTLEYRRSPIHKLKTILKVAELIIASIEDFYKELNNEYTQSLDGEQTMVLFMYILAKSGLNDVKVHCEIIQNFSTNSVLDSVSGYYATTLECCTNYICSLSGEEHGERSESIDASASLEEQKLEEKETA